MKPGRLVPVDPAGPALAFQYDPETYEVSGGVGGWAVIDRPRRRGVLEWEGVDPYQVTVALIFDRWTTRPVRSVEPELERLRRLALKVPNGFQPPVLRIDARWQHATLQWVIQDLRYRDEIRNAAGARVRCTVEVSLLEYTAAKVLLTPTQRAAERATPAVTAPQPAAARTYTVKAGDTLSAIAAKHLGDWKRWEEIARLNGIRDPRRLQIGTKLRLP